MTKKYIPMVFYSQEKVVKLHKTILALHALHPREQLVHLPQYRRLMAIYESLQ